MNKAQKLLSIRLLQGYCVAATTWRGKKYYKLMDEKFNSTAYIPAKTVDRIDRFITIKQKAKPGQAAKKLSIWKVDKWGRKTFNLSNIRRLHGKSVLKKLYLQKGTMDITVLNSFLRKNNQKKSIKKNQDEKNYSLF